MPSVAVVTGASSGIGLATTRALAAAGWSVIATARRPETAESLREIADELPGVELRTLDVTSDESVDSCIDSILTDRGGIDLLVNNAGAGHRGTLEQLTMDELSQAMELNFFGVARVTKAVLPAMRAARTGRVITVTSLNGVVALPFSDAYNAAKFAVEGLMESLATVMREFDVYISVLEPVRCKPRSSPMSVGTSTTSATTIRTRNSSTDSTDEWLRSAQVVSPPNQSPM